MIRVTNAAVVLAIGVGLSSWVLTARATQSAAEGIYTDRQAQRGDALFAEHCAACHGADLRGTDYGPGLAGPELRSRWKQRSLGELFSMMQSTMPVNSPGGLTADQNAEILAFLLRRAQFPAGAKDLLSRADVLNTLTLERTAAVQNQK